MPFSESVKSEVRQKAHFMCCVCRREPFPEVHHIVPEAEGGPDTIENAAPLCPLCHANYGNDPVKRKQIREMRDQWYDICDKRYSSPSNISYRELINQVKAIKTVQEINQILTNKKLEEIKTTSSSVLSEGASSIRFAKSYDEVIAASATVGTATSIAEGLRFDLRRCFKCGFIFPPGSSVKYCPNCNSPLP